ncbi:type II secretion system F family protein [Yinghuangia sp. ASG 101]|uniref:type II secretion system F family protein n=1 Tax=Yinghuangia sp. ASG 101 TaxID=2896848 RepID=UPI001E41022B|nr:type II secretion system F family protein [Yinghuangia sp. ASG 101]UGQ09101.1 type II secretion system F family protein [Yinghuangia sp. ASG 101]
MPEVNAFAASATAPSLLIAPALAASAIWISGVRVGRARVRDLTRGAPRPARAPRGGRRVPALLRTPRVRLAATVATCALVLAVVARSLVPLVVAVPVAVFMMRRQDRARARRHAGHLRSGIAELASVMVGELRAGQQPFEAFTVAVECARGPIRARLADALSAARTGGDVPAALSRAASPPGTDGLVRIAACWRVAADSGAGFAPALGRVAAGLRAEEAGLREVEAELSGARATTRLLAALPLFGILLGHAIGADPLSVLLHAPVGIACLVLGLVLLATGLTWTDRIAGGGTP